MNEKDEIFLCSVEQYGFLLSKSSFRQVTKYASDRERALVIERDNDGRRYFTMPQSVIENSNGDVRVLDVVDHYESRLIVFDKNGGKKFEYNGLKTTSSPKCDLSSVTHDSKGNTIISDEIFNRIQRTVVSWVCLKSGKQTSYVPLPSCVIPGTPSTLGVKAQRKMMLLNWSTCQCHYLRKVLNEIITLPCISLTATET